MRFENGRENYMKMRILCEAAAVALTCCAWGNTGVAGEEESRLAESLHKHSWSVWPEMSHLEYKEPGAMKERGTLFGLGASYTYRGWADANSITAEGGNLLRLEGRFGVGQVDYDGHLMDGTPYTMDGIDDSLLELRVLGGRDYLRPASLTTLYFGLGYRYLNDDSSSDPHGYRRESNYFYLPLGVQHTRSLSAEWLLVPAAEFDLLVLGLQVSHLGDADPSLGNVTNEQSFGFGLRGSVKFQKRVGSLDLGVEPFVTYWNVDESNRKYDNGIAIREPENWSLEYGLRLVLAF